jgi:regulator of protease activity HflC (stomatin/prohibitin superfamily)
MKRHVVVALGALACVVMACRTVPAGNRGVLVYMLGGERGVETKELGVGRYFIWPFTQELYIFPIFQQNVVWSANGGPGDKSISFQTREGLSVNGDFGISYAVVPDSVTSIFDRYRLGLDEITDLYLRNEVRDALNLIASEMDIEAVYGPGRQSLLRRVDSTVRSRVSTMGITVDRVYTIGDFRMPPRVVQAINAKIEATQLAQQRENEVREAEAQALKKQATARGDSASVIIRENAQAEVLRIQATARANAAITEAKAEAEANTLRMQSLSTPLLNYELIKRWNGTLPTVTGGSVPLLDVRSLFGTGTDRK